MTWYLIVFGIIAVWVLVDGLRRGAEPQRAVLYGVGTLLLGPVVAPYYFASRPLVSGEVRQGNFAWNALKYFAVFWSVFMLAIGIPAILRAGQSVPAPDADVATTGVTLVFVTTIVIWLMPFAGSLALGQSLRDESASERGPTGAAGEQRRPSRVS